MQNEYQLRLRDLDFAEKERFLIRRHTPFSPYVAPRFPHISEINSLFSFCFSEKTKEAADRFGGVVEGHKAEHAALMQSKRDGEAEHENKLSQIELRHREQAIFNSPTHALFPICRTPFPPYVRNGCSVFDFFQLEALEARYEQKLVSEIDRYQQLYADKELLNETWEHKLRALATEHATQRRTASEAHEQRMREQRRLVDGERNAREAAAREAAETQSQLEEDVDREVEDLKECF